VVAQDPGNARAMRDLGKALTQTGHPQEAERELEQSLRVDPSSAEAHYQLAQIYRQLKEPAKAEQELESTKDLLAEKRSKEESVLAAAGKRGDATQQLGLSPKKDPPASPDGTH
jgi:cytochrome c-type biogenesis protein CcmH/NrfG